MNKPWLGYLSAFLLFAAGVLQILGRNLKIGILFIVLSAVSFYLQLRMSRGSGKP